MMSERTVVITGMGPISAVGIGNGDFRDGLREGRDGREPAQDVIDEPGELQRVARCRDFYVEDYLESEKTYLDRCSEFVLSGCILALKDAGLDWRNINGEQLGLSLGTAYGCLQSMTVVCERVHERGIRHASPMIFTHSFANAPASLASIEYDIQGASATMTTGDTSSAAAVQYAFDIVRDGRTGVMLAGGADAFSTPMLAALGRGPQGVNVPGEGACIMVLESSARAEQRGADVLAEIAAIELCSDAARSERVDMLAVEAAGIKHVDTGEDLPRIDRGARYGHTFGSEFALRMATAIHQLHHSNCGHIIVHLRDDNQGRSAAAVLRR